MIYKECMAIYDLGSNTLGLPPSTCSLRLIGPQKFHTKISAPDTDGQPSRLHNNLEACWTELV